MGSFHHFYKDPVANCLQALSQARTYAEWREVALELDRLEGADAWKQDETSDDYDYLLIKARLGRLQRLRRGGDVRPLVFELHEGLHGNLGNISHPRLYNQVWVGTKKLIEDYVAEVSRCLDYVCAGDFPNFPEDEKAQFFQRTAAAFGRSALMLSGGATLGMFHLGVVKALWSQNLLPRVISGSSAGAIIAGMVAVRSDEELARIFDPQSLNLQAFRRVSFQHVLRAGVVMDVRQLENCIDCNVDDLTFTEAFERTGRMVGITVSPAEPLQQGRLLNYLTAPNVLLRRAVLASCAIPAVFPPVMLQARNYEGDRVPYMPGKRWIDGSLSADLPMLRLARLHNVNHYIVSQTNPHVVPFMRDDSQRNRGMLPFAQELLLRCSRETLKLAREYFSQHSSARMVDRLNEIIAQRYSGDVNIFPRHSARKLLRLLSNPSTEDIAGFIAEGERATWPKLERVRHQTRIARTFEDCLKLLEDRALARRQAPRGKRPEFKAVP